MDSSATISGGYANYASGVYSTIVGGYADTITAAGDYSYLFGVNSNLGADSTFMVDMPHIRFGKESDGYEFPTVDGTNGQVLMTNGAGQVAWGTAAAGSGQWSFLVSDGADTTLQMGGRWGLARPGNTLYGTTDSTHVNFGVACTTGATGQNHKYCTVAGGQLNKAGNLCATVSGGYSNTASGMYSSVGGGRTNSAGNGYATVAGGYSNTAAGLYTTVAGGVSNNASADYAAVAGGYSNTASGYAAAIGGGRLNTGGGSHAAVAGGYSNAADSTYASVSGGYNNTAGFHYAFVGGGYTNNAGGWSSGIAGGRNNFASDSCAFVGGGRYNKARGPYSTVAGGGGASTADSNLASGHYAAIGGGRRNIASNYNATVAGGFANVAGNGYTAIGGGNQNTASMTGATVAGGFSNNAGGEYATVAGGEDNTANITYAAVGGGNFNVASDTGATVGGGRNNTASGLYATVPGGWDNIASGNKSFAAGYSASATHAGSFVWSDTTSTTFGSTKVNQFRVRAVGGIDLTGNVTIRNASGTIVVELGEGLDYAEGFDVRDKDKISPGAVMAIDPENPGKLKMSDRPYDTKVAGITAGANNLGSGVRLGNGRYDCDVALAGRVYCNVDATETGVEPGDLLTTSGTPGYAMKVTDYVRARGAIIGKAMQKLEKGEKGQVLVLVTLQ